MVKIMAILLQAVVLLCFVLISKSFVNVRSSKELSRALKFRLNDGLGPGPEDIYKSLLDKLYTNTALVEEKLVNFDITTLGKDLDFSISRVIDIFNAIGLDGNSKARILDILSVNHHSTGSSFAELKMSAWHLLELAAASPVTLPAFTAVYAFFLFFGGLGYDDNKVGSPYDAGTKTYSVETAERFYASRPFFVLRRLLKLASITGAFNLKLFIDWRTGNVEKNQKERAKEALVLATQLGPTFIKLGQALSIRTDLIPEAYALELRQLQDAVPPFESAAAMEIIKREMGIRSNIGEKFRSISPLPVASASIGQVYRGTLLDGRDVAVKVQRPKVLGEIALDLYLLRLITPLQVKLTNAINGMKTEQSDIDVAISLVDEWGRGFVAEVDYRLEAANTKQFTLAMEKRGLNAVTAPTVVDELSGPKVLVTEWVEGTRLDRDASSDVPR
jgi:ABC1 atypical kinase-like domain